MECTRVAENPAKRERDREIERGRERLDRQTDAERKWSVPA